MGRRSASESVVAIVQAFSERRTWRQDALGAHVGLGPKALRAQLLELASTGIFPLRREPDGRHVYWSLPRDWMPGGVVLPEAELAYAIRVVARAPRSRLQGRVLARLVTAAPPRVPAPPSAALLTEARPDGQEETLALLESSVGARLAVHLRYESTTSGAGGRDVSVVRVDPAPPVRFLAQCHRARELRWFRLDRVRAARLAPEVPYDAPGDDVVDAHVRATVDGYHGGARPMLHRFFVRDPDARWAEGNLLAPMRGTRAPDGLSVEIETAALERVARFVVGLGAAARPETPELRDAVRRLAEGALAGLC